MVLIYSQTGVFSAPRKSLKSINASIIILVGLVLIETVALLDYATYSSNVSVGEAFFLSYLIYCILFLYDTFVIDIFIIVFLHPAWLKLPNTEEFHSYTYHLKTLPIGFVLGLFFTIVINMTLIGLKII